MLKVGDVARALGGALIASSDAGREVTGCYVSDMLSDVLANCGTGNLWITHHTHSNVVVVAAVKELSAVLVTGGRSIAPETLNRAGAEKVNMITTAMTAFEAAGVIYNLLHPKGGE